MKPEELLDYMIKTFSYDNIDPENFGKNYRLKSPEVLLKTKNGVCWDFVEYEREIFKKNNIKCKTFFIFLDDNKDLPSHTFLTYQLNNSFNWFEYSWEKERNIRKYQTELELLLDVKERFKQFNKEKGYIYKENIFMFEYKKPKYNITCNDFYKHCTSYEIINI